MTSMPSGARSLGMPDADDQRDALVLEDAPLASATRGACGYRSRERLGEIVLGGMEADELGAGVAAGSRPAP